MGKSEKVKNILFIIIGLIALIVSFNPDIQREKIECYMFQLFAFTIITIGACNLASNEKK